MHQRHQHPSILQAKRRHNAVMLLRTHTNRLRPQLVYTAATAGLVALSHTPCAHMPAIIATTYATTCGTGFATMATSAGPGHIPEMPQPAPNRIPPRINVGSIELLVGMENFASQYGFRMMCFWRISWKPGRAIRRAPPMTNNSVRSQAGYNGLRKAITCGNAEQAMDNKVRVK